MTGEPYIDYDALALEAMRGVVRNVLVQAARMGLPGEHHFYIAFDTEAPGVTLSKRLKERYPREMTIVLQHRFWDLNVLEDRFEVKLSFDSIPERIVVPFAAIKVFFDPSVQYGLRFEEADGTTSAAEVTQPSRDASGGVARAVSAPRTTSKKSRVSRKSKVERDGLVTITPSSPGAPPVSIPRSNGSGQVSAAASNKAANAEAGSEDSGSKEAQDKPANSGAQILSLDQFRKK